MELATRVTDGTDVQTDERGTTFFKETDQGSTDKFRSLTQLIEVEIEGTC